MELETTYTITGKRTGQITFKFNLNGDLVFFKYDGEPFNEKQRLWFYQRIATHESLMKHWLCIKEFTVVKGEPVITFETFWEAYANKNKRIKAEQLWNKLNPDEKFNAIASIKRYNAWLNRKNIAKALPDTYLSQKRWLDEM